MDKRSGLTLVGMAAFVMLATGSHLHKRRRYSWDAGSTTITGTTATATVTATATATETATDPPAPDPKADYTKIDDAKLDGKAAFGKTLLLHVRRGSTDASHVTLFSCTLGSSGFMQATYAPAQRPLVLAIPTTLSLSDCPRVVLRITGTEAYTKDLKGELEAVLDVKPQPPPKLPPGVDYVSMDDINIDGNKAAGKIAQLRMYRGRTEEKKFTGYPCGDSGGGGINFVYVTFAPEQKQLVKDLSASVENCDPVKIKLTSQAPYSNTWNAQLLGVDKGG